MYRTLKYVALQANMLISVPTTESIILRMKISVDLDAKNLLHK